MLLNFSENGIHLVFDVLENGDLNLLHCSAVEFDPASVDEKTRGSYLPFSIYLTGEDIENRGTLHFGRSKNAAWKYLSHSMDREADGKLLTVRMTNGYAAVTLFYRFYDGIPVVRSWTRVQNTGDAPIGLEYLSSFCLLGIDGGADENEMNVYFPHNAWMREVNWTKQSVRDAGFKKNCGPTGIRRSSARRIGLSNTGSWSSKEYLPMGALENAHTGETMLWQIEHNGSWQWEISDWNRPMYLLLSGPSEVESQWYKELKTGEFFDSVPAAVCFGSDFNDSLAAMTRYRRKISGKYRADAGLPVIFNDYMNCLFAKPTTEKELPLIDRAAQLGAEYFVMDAGWYATGKWWDSVGEWMPSIERFPNGIREVFDYVRKKGMIPGIWLEIEVMGVKCPILDRFTDDCFMMRHGKRVVCRGRYQLDYRNPKVREFATSVVDRVVNEYGIGYIKFDYNIDVGTGSEVNSDSVGDALLSHNRAYLEWVDSIRAKYPDLVLETCSSGGMRMDYAMLAHHTIQSVTDMEEIRGTAQIAAATCTGILPEQAGIWVLPQAFETDNLFEMNIVAAMPMRFYLGGSAETWTPEQAAIIKEGIECYKKNRAEIAQSIPFYPLGIPSYDGDWLCSAYRNGKRVTVCVFRMKGETDTLTVPMPEAVADAQIAFPAKTDATVRTSGKNLKVTIPAVEGAVYLNVLLK